MRRALAIATLLALSIPAPAFARGTFDPTTEFEQHEWIPIHLGPLNLSITKAVVYLMLGTLGTIAIGIFTMRSRLALLCPRRRSVADAAVHEHDPGPLPDHLDLQLVHRVHDNALYKVGLDWSLFVEK